MGRFFGMITRVALWAASGAALGYIGVMVYEMAFTGGALTMSSAHALSGGTIGLAVGGVVGFFQKG